MRTSKFVRLLSALLAMLMMLATVSLFASCGGDEGGETETETESTGEGTAEKDEYEALTKTKYNKVLKIVSLPDSANDFSPDESNKGETITDKMIARNNRIESDYGVTMNVQLCADYAKLTETINLQLTGNLDEYDVYIGQLHNFAGNVLKNQCVDFNLIPGINMEGEWWDPACRETLIMDGSKNFMMTGDISTSSMLISACMAFNKNLMKSSQLEEPYDMVENDEWTLDALYNYVNGFTNASALDGKGQFGLTCWAFDIPYSLFYGANETFVEFDVDTGLPKVEFDEVKVTNIYDRIFKIIVTAESNYRTYDDAKKDGADVPDKPAYDVFAEGRALFVDVTLSKISVYLTNMVDDYGVVPMPKYDNSQEDYLTFVNGAAPMFMVATTEKDLAFVGNLLEAMATYSYEYVTDDLYEVVCKSKNARDPQTADMIDIILRSRIYDFAYYAKLALSDVVYNNLLAERETISSQLKGAKSSSESQLRLLLKAWDKIMAQQKK